MPPYARRTRNVYDPASSEPFKLSRSKIDLFLNCPRCFYLDRRLGIAAPSGPAFTLNVAVDVLLKKEFDTHRAKGTPHPLMHTYGVKAVPFRDPRMGAWRENFVGVQYLHVPTNLLVFGAVDDLWVADDGKTIHIVDYKATSKEGEIELSDTKWHNQYRRQMEVYQWLVRRNGLTVSDIGYFVYVNGKKDRAAFDGRLEFDVKLIPYRGSDAWVEGTLTAAAACLNGSASDRPNRDGSAIPAASAECEFCAYRAMAASVETKNSKL